MNPNGLDDILWFRGIPRQANRRSARFLTSFCIHIVGVGLLLAIVPKIAIPDRAVRFHTALVAPTEAKAPPKPVHPPVVIEKSPKPALILRPLPRVQEAKITAPKLEDAPRLPNTPPPAVVPPPVPVAAIRPPVQTGLFGSNLSPQANPKLPVPVAHDAGFDSAASEVASAQPASIIPAGFDNRQVESRPATVAAKVETGAFGQTAAQPRARLAAGNVSHAAFDVVPEAEKPAAPETIRKSGFDQPKTPSAPAKQAAHALAALRPIEILEKPAPAYTAEARTRKVEGTVLLDVIFAATGEVRVLGVVRGLGHGLDENAIDAARRIRFTPALQSGTPVDQHVTLHVVFQITG